MAGTHLTCTSASSEFPLALRATAQGRRGSRTTSCPKAVVRQGGVPESAASVSPGNLLAASSVCCGCGERGRTQSREISVLTSGNAVLWGTCECIVRTSRERVIGRFVIYSYPLLLSDILLIFEERGSFGCNINVVLKKNLVFQKIS